MADIILDRVTHIKVISRPKAHPFQPVVVYEDLTEGIESNSMFLTEILIDGDIEVGQANSSMFEVVIHDITDITGYEISVWSSDAQGGSIKQLFTGYVDKCIYQKYGNAYQITAYDYLAYLSDKDVSQIIKSVCDYYIERADTISSYTFGNLIETFVLQTASEYGLALMTSNGLQTMINYDTTLTLALVTVLKSYCPKSITFRELIRQLGESELGFIKFNRHGYLDFVSLAEVVSNLSIANAFDISENFETNNAEFSENSYNPPKTVNVFDRDGSLIDTYTATADIVLSGHTFEDFNGEYNISNNIFVSMWRNASSYKNAIAQSLLLLLASLDYQSSNIPLIVSDFDIELGKSVVISNNETNIFCPVFQNTVSGSLLIEQTISAVPLSFGYSNISSETQSIADNNLALSDIDGIKSTVSELSEKTNNISSSILTINDKLNNKRTTIYETSYKNALPQTKDFSIKLSPGINRITISWRRGVAVYNVNCRSGENCDIYLMSQSQSAQIVNASGGQDGNNSCIPTLTGTKYQDYTLDFTVSAQSTSGTVSYTIYLTVENVEGFTG